jgi:hypothetical protein
MSHNTIPSAFELLPLLTLLAPSPSPSFFLLLLYLPSSSSFFLRSVFTRSAAFHTPPAAAAGFVLARHISGLALPGFGSGVVHCCSVASR